MDVFGFLNTKLGQGVFYVLLCHVLTLCISDSKETTSTSRKKVKHNTGKSKNLNVEVSSVLSSTCTCTDYQ